MYGQRSEHQMYAASNYNGRVNSTQLSASSGGQMYNNFGTCCAGSTYSMPSAVLVMDNCPSLGGQIHQIQSGPPVVDYGNPAQATLCQQLQFPYGLQSSPQVGNGDAYSIVSSRGCTTSACNSIPSPRQQLQACPLVCLTTCTNQPLGTTSSSAGQGTSASTAANEDAGGEDDSSRTVFVENIPKTVTLKEVINFFKTAGNLEFSERTGQLNVRLIVKHGIPTGEAVLQYASRTGAEKALAMFCDACFPPLQEPMKLTIAYGPYWSSNSDSSLVSGFVLTFDWPLMVIF
ncbi:hypothetical protein D918_00783 [Trichuris suis]|nr:hypothetical protein D918_00783 [Trichuris suis]